MTKTQTIHKEYLDDQYRDYDGEVMIQKHDNYSYWIGRLLLSFSELESGIDYLLLELISDRAHEVGYQTIKYFKYKQKILFLRDNYNSLLRICLKKPKLEKFLKLVEKQHKVLSDIGEFRNSVCHAEWNTLDKNGMVKTKVRQDTGGVFFFKKRITCKGLYNMSRKSDSVYNSLESFHEKILDVTLRK